MKTFLRILTVISIGLFGLTSCNFILTSAYGLKGIQELEENKIIRYAEKYKIPVAHIYELDTSYHRYLWSLKTDKNPGYIKNHYQPLQALYFDRAGQLQSFQVNCYAGGFPNLEWDRNGIMSTFPPMDQAPIDSLFSAEKLMTFFNPLSQTENLEIEKYDFVVVVFWNHFMGRQSKRFIRFVQDNSKLAAEDQKVKIIYVNTDNHEDYKGR